TSRRIHSTCARRRAGDSFEWLERVPIRWITQPQTRLPPRLRGEGWDRFLFFSCCLQDAEILLRAPRKKNSPVTQNVTCVCNTIRVYFRHDLKVCRSSGGPLLRAFFMPACGRVRPRLR